MIVSSSSSSQSPPPYSAWTRTPPPPPPHRNHGTYRAWCVQLFGCAVVIHTVMGLFQSSLRLSLWHSSRSSSTTRTRSDLITWEGTRERASASVVEAPPQQGFSACLLWMDDNPRLVEWIAYHYYMLNLTYLVLGVAPGATTSPHSILQRWRDRITIKLWKLQALHEKKKTNESKEVRNKFTNNSSSNINDILQVDYTLMDVREDNPGDFHQHWRRHIERQTRFYQTCAFFLKDQNRTWTAFHDVDEYIVLRQSHNTSNIQNNSQMITTTPTTPLPPPPPPGIVLHYLQQYNHDYETLSPTAFNATWTFWRKHAPCLPIPRALFGTVPSTDDEVMQGVPRELILQLEREQSNKSNAVDFIRRLVTLNDRYQVTESRHNIMDMDGVPKVVMDVSKLDPVNHQEYASLQGSSPHRPFNQFCPYPPFWFLHPSLRNTPPLIPLRIHHYLGRWELYSVRPNDARRSGHRHYEVWAAKASGQAGGMQDAHVRRWLAGFVAQIGGATTARALLEDAGLPSDYRVSESYTQRWAYNKSSGVKWKEKRWYRRAANRTNTTKSQR